MSARGASGLPIISAETIVVAPPEEVFAFLDRLENHWQVADRFVRVLSINGGPAGGGGGTVRVRGPFGIGRTAATEVVSARPPELLRGTARVGRQTVAEVSWRLERHAKGTALRLEAEVSTAGFLDRLILRLGGRRWLRRRFESTLLHLKRRLE